MKNKKIILLFQIIIIVVSISFLTFSKNKIYSEWYYEKFGDYPEGTVNEWKNDPLYSQYLSENGENGIDNSVNGANGFNSGNGVIYINPYSPFDYPKLSNLYWNGYVAHWNCTGNASCYQVMLCHFEDKVTVHNVTKTYFDFASYMTHRKGEFCFYVRAFNDKTGWTNYEKSSILNITKYNQYTEKEKQFSGNITAKDIKEGVKIIKDSINITANVCSNLFEGIIDGLKKSGNTEAADEILNGFKEMENEINE